MRRPRVPTERGGMWKVIEALALTGTIATVVIAGAAWTSLPARIPTHFGGDGTPDGWGGRWALLVMPVVGVVMYAGLTILERYPHIYNYPVRITEENAGRQYRLAVDLITLLKLEMVWMFATLTWGTVRVARGDADGLGTFSVLFYLAALFGTITVYMVRAVRGR
ncbi:MAG TPA: DUF1648 domain-containing protein [Thermoleophilia bacterium]|nr:DUF1648 domain-containing protein [Thermoleophilia bacterium]